MSDYALEVTNLHKSFKLPTEKAGKLKTALVNIAKGVRGYKEQKVLRGLSFQVKKGEFFGIVGRNGSGKSTLLKIISQIYEPTKGSVRVSGKLVPFIELGVGFNPELTGRENVYLNGALLGFSNAEIDHLYQEIVDFAELHDFMDQKLKNYSSGMQVRLAFSLAIRSQADILVLDEVLAVGDEAFQKKCNDYFYEIRGQKTIVLVTHSMDNVRGFCDSAILIEGGKIIASGDPSDVADRYSDLFVKDMNAKIDLSREDTYPQIDLHSVAVTCAGAQSDRIPTRTPFTISVDIESLTELRDATIAVAIVTPEGATALHFPSKHHDITKGRSTITFDIENIFNDNLYHIDFAVADSKGQLLYKSSQAHYFRISSAKSEETSKYSITKPAIKVSITHDGKK